MLAVVLSFLLACETEPSSPEIVEAPQKPAVTEKVVVYSGRSESLVGELFEKMEQELQFDIEVQYGSTSEMATRFLTEGAKVLLILFSHKILDTWVPSQSKGHWRHCLQNYLPMSTNAFKQRMALGLEQVVD